MSFTGIDGVETRFSTFPSILYQCQSMKLPKRKTTDKFTMHVTINFLKN